MGTFLCFGSVFFFLLVFVFLGNSIRIVPEYQRLIVFRQGNIIGKRGPGLVLTLPFLDRVVKVDLRPFEHKLEDVQMTTRDNNNVIVSWKCNFIVNDPEKVALALPNFASIWPMLEKEAEMIVREMDRDEILQGIGRLETRLTDRLTEKVKVYGIRINEVRVLDVKRSSAE